MQDTAALPPNLATEGIADAIALGAREGGGDGSAVLMVVQPGERNSYDQQASHTPANWLRNSESVQVVHVIPLSQLCGEHACANLLKRVVTPKCPS